MTSDIEIVRSHCPPAGEPDPAVALRIRGELITLAAHANGAGATGGLGWGGRHLPGLRRRGMLVAVGVLAAAGATAVAAGGLGGLPGLFSDSDAGNGARLISFLDATSARTFTLQDFRELQASEVSRVVPAGTLLQRCMLDSVNRIAACRNVQPQPTDATPVRLPPGFTWYQRRDGQAAAGLTPPTLVCLPERHIVLDLGTNVVVGFSPQIPDTASQPLSGPALARARADAASRALQTAATSIPPNCAP
ncbi:MAG: hypothetical protein U0Y82_05495 [Thermoleophilia bacterium]